MHDCSHCIAVLAAFIAPVAAQPSGLVVSVAASVYDALDEIAGLYRAATGVTVALNAGGSNTLARQIVEGAKAGLFISADEIQMDVVEKAGRIVPGTRTRLLTNELAVVVPQSATNSRWRGCSRAASRGWRWVSPARFPPACTAARWLEHEGAWARLESKVIPFPTVRGGAVGGRSRARRCGHRLSNRCDDIGRARDRAHVAPRIIRISTSRIPRRSSPARQKRTARQFLEFLKGPAARAVFDRRGFGSHDPMSAETWVIARFTVLMASTGDGARAAAGDRDRLAARAQGSSPERRFSKRSSRCRWCCRRSRPGLLLLWLFGRRSPVGQALDAIGIEVIFTWKAVVLVDDGDQLSAGRAQRARRNRAGRSPLRRHCGDARRRIVPHPADHHAAAGIARHCGGSGARVFARARRVWRDDHGRRRDPRPHAHARGRHLHARRNRQGRSGVEPAAGLGAAGVRRDLRCRIASSISKGRP